MTIFNPSHFEHEGVRYKAQLDTSPSGCEGCAFLLPNGNEDGWNPCEINIGSHGDCTPKHRTDRQNIIWVRPQEENKS